VPEWPAAASISPGHGFAAADSHYTLPVDRRGLRAILADDAQPYAWLSTSLAR